MERDFRELHIVYPSSESSHHCPVKVGIIFILIPIDEIEIPDHQPRPKALSSYISQFLKKLDLILIMLGPIDTGQPPCIAISWTELDR